MKDRILKLCKRLKNCTLNDITQLMDIEPSVLEVILLFLINENKIQEKDFAYKILGISEKSYYGMKYDIKKQSYVLNKFQNCNLKLLITLLLI